MKFYIEHNTSIEHRHLFYRSNEFSFDMKPIEDKIDYELMLNKICLSVVNKKIIQLWGFCGLNSSMKFNTDVPEHKKGNLFVEHNLDYGFAYEIEDNLPVKINYKTGWICIGDPDIQGRAVEFITNCVAVIDEKSKFLSLWLKPDYLPNLAQACT